MDYLGEYDDYAGPYPDEPPMPERRRRLHTLVFLDGRLVDCDVARVEGTKYESLARDFDRERQPPEPEVQKPAWERELEDLDAIVGGRVALLALDAEPLAERPELPEECAGVAELVEKAAIPTYDGELRIAILNGLAELWRADPARVSKESPALLALALTWVVAKANGRTGPGSGITQKQLTRAFWAKGFSSDLAHRVTAAIRGYQPSAPTSAAYYYRPDRSGEPSSPRAARRRRSRGPGAQARPRARRPARGRTG